MKPSYSTTLTLLLMFFAINNVNASAGDQNYLVQEVANGIFYHQGIHQDPSEKNIGAIANVGFIIGKDCVAVIDSGGSYIEGTLLRQAIKQRTELPICYVINTHVHPDHTFGNAAFKDDNPEYIGHEKLPAAMQSRQDYFARVFKETLGTAFTGTEFITPSRTVSINEPITIDLGDRYLTLTAYSTSHTDHDLTVFDQQSKTLWTGDLLFIDRIPVIDGSILGWITLTTQFQTIDLSIVIPGHGPATDNWQQAFLNQLRYLSIIRDEIRVIIADLGTIKEASETVGLHEQAQWELYDNYHRRNVTASFVELEWE
jgi:quinoprotein relay system zinc metallohydrolase 2